jgi:hypothetical protein
MQVVGPAGQLVGHVKDARAEDFLVDRPDRGTVVLSYEAIRAMLGEQIVLAEHAEEAETAE